MTIHREGYATIAFVTLACVLLAYLTNAYLTPLSLLLSVLSYTVLTGFWLFILSFFRVPSRTHTFNDDAVISPADGKVVVIEEVHDSEYFNEKRLQISVFMSPANVHQNRYPVSGKIVYSKYHKGKYLVAWDPKSSTENERHSVVVSNDRGSILVKQIAGAVARRIVNYAQPGADIKQNEEMGFIKFGSRVDLLLPLNAIPMVNIGDNVLNGVTVLATLP